MDEQPIIARDSPPLPLPEGLTLGLLALLIFAANVFWNAAAYQVVTETKLFGQPGGAETVEAERTTGQNNAQQLARARLGLWAGVLAFPFFLLTLPFLLRFTRDIRPADVGLTRERLGRNLFSGLLTGCALTPLVVMLHLLVQWWFRTAVGKEQEEHPYTMLASGGLSPIEWVLLIVGAVVVAPIYEELFFRGVLQRLFVRVPASAWGGMIAAAALATALRWKGIKSTWHEGGAPFWTEWAPLIFVLVLIPHFLILRYRTRAPAPAAIFASSVLFAAVHSFAWPTPVALTVLGVGLGTLAQRQRSLAGPIALHGTFNAFNCALLMFQVASTR